MKVAPSSARPKVPDVEKVHVRRAWGRDLAEEAAWKAKGEAAWKAGEKKWITKGEAAWKVKLAPRPKAPEGWKEAEKAWIAERRVNQRLDKAIEGVARRLRAPGTGDDDENLKRHVAQTIEARLGPEHSAALVKLALRETPKSVQLLDATHNWVQTREGNEGREWTWRPATADSNSLLDPASPTVGLSRSPGDVVRKGNSPAVLKGLRQEGVGRLVDIWAETSNDSNAQSLALQKAARLEFGIRNSAPWKTSARVSAKVESDLKQNGRLYRAFLRAQYDATQAFLKSHRLTELTLFRGMIALLPAGTSNVALRPLSSFTHIVDQAIGFADYTGSVIAVRVPAARVLATPATGIGCLEEGEIVVIGGKDQVRVLRDVETSPTL